MKYIQLTSYLFFILLALPSKELQAQRYTIALWKDGNIPNSKTTKPIYNEVVTDNEDGYIGVNNVQIPNIKIFLPTKRNATGQALIICPGGAYRGLAYDLEGLDYAKYLNTIGVAGIVLKYRLPNSSNSIIPYKSPLLDVKRAIRITRYNAEKWNINPSKIGVMGSSAGGHLATTIATHFDYGNSNATDPIERVSCRPDFMILLYPVITFRDPFVNKVSLNNLIGENPDSTLINFFSNELQVEDNTPPAFIVLADNGKAVPVENSLLFYSALHQHNIPAELHIFSEGGHGFGLGVGNEHYGMWPEICHQWLRWINSMSNK